MSISGYFNTLRQVEDRVTTRMAEMLQAGRDVATYCNGMAFDGATAEEIYRSALADCGVPRRETSDLNVAALRILLKTVRTSQTSPNAPAMAMDARDGDSTLSSILNGVKPPRNHTALWR